MSNPLIYFVVLAWNQKDMTIKCLKSILSLDYPNMRVVVVDNGSTDGTPEAIADQFPNVKIVRSSVNLGIAGGYNLGLEYALQQGAEYVMVSNNDIIVEPSMISRLVKALEESQRAGVAMPKIYHYYGDQTRLWCTGARWRRFPPSVKMIGVNAKDSPRFNYLKEIEYAPSCCLLIRRAVLEEVGGFDVGYFFYNDDWDFSARVRKAGYRILYVPDAKIWHMVSASTQKSEKPARWWYIMGRSTVRFYFRHSTSRDLLIFSAWFIIRECIKLKPGRVLPFVAGLMNELAVERGWAATE